MCVSKCVSGCVNGCVRGAVGGAVGPVPALVQLPRYEDAVFHTGTWRAGGASQAVELRHETALRRVRAHTYG